MIVTVDLFDILALAFVILWVGFILWGARK